MAKKAKRFAEGGFTITPNQPQANTYPFPATNTGAGVSTDSTTPGVNQTFNIQPTASAQQPSTTPAYKKGGKVSSASKRADGCAIRGKTRA